MNSTTQDPRKRLRLHAMLSVLTLLVGAVLMAFMITVESEPGLLPILLVASGLGGYLVTRVRMRSQPR